MTKLSYYAIPGLNLKKIEVQRQLGKTLKKREKRVVDNIVNKAVAIMNKMQQTNIKVDQVKSKSRFTPILVTRYFAMVSVVKYIPDLPKKSVGRIFNRDHSTVYNAMYKWEELVDTNYCNSMCSRAEQMLHLALTEENITKNHE